MGLRLKNSSGNYVELNAPSSIATDFGLTLPVNDGDSGQYLQTNGSGTLSWSGAGKILQVVSAVYTGQASTTSQSYVDFSLNASITPSSTSSKILVFVNLNVNVNNNQININIARNGTDINSDADGLGFARMYQTVNTWDTISFPYLDSPSTTDPTTYRVRFKEQTGSGTAYIGYNSNDESYMYLLEVAG